MSTTVSELLDQIEARIEALTQPDDHPKRALFAVGDVARLLAAVRAVERLAEGWENTGEPATRERRAALRGSAARIRHALAEALEGEG